MVSEFLTWWRTELMALARLRPASGSTAHRRAGVVALQDTRANAPPAVELLTLRRGREASLGRFDLAGAGLSRLRTAASALRGPVLLRVPPGLLLEQLVSLPLAAEREAARVLSYEMDRLTPFTATELFWTYQVERRDRAANQVRFRLFLIPRARLAPVLDALAEAGLRPAALDAPAADGSVRQLALANVRRSWVQRRGLALAGGACAALAVAAAALPFLAQAQALQRVDARVAALRPQVDQAETLRRAIRARAATTDIVQAARDRSGDALGVLAALTTVLPDDTYLTELTLRSRALSITGESAAAARLIAALEAEPGFRNPAFAAPVTRTVGGKLEGFSIRAEVAP